MIKNNKGKIAIMQIMLLIVGIVAISYAIGGEIGFVSGEEDEKRSQADLPIGATTPSVTSLNLLTGPKDDPVEKWNFNSETNVWEKPGSEETIKPEHLSKVAEEYGVAESTSAGVGGGGSWGAGALQGLKWAATAAAMVQFLGPLAGIEDTGELNALTYAAATASFTAGLLDKGLTGEGWTRGATKWGITIAVAVVIYYATYEETSYRIATFDCKAWQPAEGGENCEPCNNQGILSCSEYQCKSLGQNCKLLNDESTGRQLCVDSGQGDVEPPVIEPNDMVLTEGYEYNPVEVTSTTGRGVEIVDESAPNDPEGKCIKAFTPLTFGISVSEPAMCRIGYIRRDNFEDYDYDFGESFYDYNHTQTLNLPSAEAAEAENLTIYNNNDFNLYVKCKDGNGNENEGDFVFKFCVDQGPDTTPPLIEETSFINNRPVSHDQTELNFTAYINEPADCRWDTDNRAYDDMVNEMTCAQTTDDSTIINGKALYACDTTLTGIKSEQENKYYFKCRDQPLADNETDRNTNTESQPKDGFVIVGTRQLYIDEVGPKNETVRDSTDAVKVTLTAETSAGYNEGEAICFYGEEGEPANIQFFNTDSYTHSTDIFLLEGEYEYTIKCVDLGGNSDTKTVRFEVESDSNAPIVVRAFKETANLKITTSEAAECVYDVTDCGFLFEDGLAMTAGEQNTHYTEWNAKTKFYIKCKDEYGNKPSPNQCSAIIKPLEQ